jgi:hypothetical protein
MRIESGPSTWDELVARLEGISDLDESARSSGAFRRRRQVADASSLVRLCFAYVLGGLSLRSLSAWAEERGLASLSDVALLKRLKGSADWLGALVSSLLSGRYPEASVGLASHRQIVAVDATMVVPPGRKNDYWVVHTVFDLTALRIRSVEVSDRHEAEKLSRGGVDAGELRVADRAHARVGELAKIVECGGDFLVRLPSQNPRLLDVDGTVLDRLALCRQARHAGFLDRPVFAASARSKITVKARLVIIPLPSQKIEKAQRKARKNASDGGYEPSKAGIEMAGFLMFITSLPAKEWTPERLLATYRLRWQVEIAFKRIKSIIGLENLRARDPDLARLWINTALLAALLAEDTMPDFEPEEPDSLPRAA